MEADHRVDIRDASATKSTVAKVSPDVVIHLAAQPLVRESYRDPRTTFETNVVGTMNVMEAVCATSSVGAHLVITTDKVYRNVNRREGYVEEDPLGAADPYSSSKAMADLLAQSWVKSFAGPPTAIARAGNVIGGGDVSADRLIPDLLAAFASGRPAEIRFPDAVRPWQHVLDCLNGYLVLVDALLDGRGAGEWNFGPGPESFVTVAAVADLAVGFWGEGASWRRVEGDNPREAGLLALDSAKSESALGWRNALLFPASIEWTVEWHKKARAGKNARDVTLTQIAAFSNK
jgi:CDP-glucose 4,6-dehydratase